MGVSERRVLVIVGVGVRVPGGGVAVGPHAAGHDARVAVVHLVLVQVGARGHGVVGAETGLASANDDVEDDAGEVGGCAQDGEGVQGLVDSADVDAGGGAPVGGVAGGRDGVRHAVAYEAEGDEPEEEEDGVGGGGEDWREAIAAVGDGGEDEV